MRRVTAALWLGTLLLAALPSLFNRYIHANLFAHWLILAALWLFTDDRRRDRLGWWLPLIAVTALVHNYLLIMVGAIWASTMLERVICGQVRDRLTAAGHIVIVGATVGVLAWWLGAAGDFVPTHNYGAFAMPLDALVNPANSDYTTLLPVTGQREGRGFEGFQYLGAGLLALLCVAAVVAATRPRAPGEHLLHSHLRWLIPALVALTLLAISNYPDIAGQRLARFPLPAALTPVLDLVRASGRLFWPVAYVLVLAGVVAIYRLGRERAMLVLATLAVIQGIDLARMATTIRAAGADADAHRLYVRTLDPRWTVAIAAAADVTLVPADPTHDLALFQEVAWRATSRGIPVRTVYAARTSRRVAARQALEHAQFAAGNLSPGRLYVLLPGEPVPAAARARLRVLDGMRVVMPLASPSSPRSAS